MILFGPLSSLVQALHTDDPRQYAAGFAFGALLGLIPKGNLFGLVFFLLFFLLKIDKSLAALTAVFFTAIGYMLDPLAHVIGRTLLSSPWLGPVWTFLYDLPLVPLTRFNNTVVLGNVAIGLVLFWPLYALFLRLVHVYHARYKQQVERWRVVQALKSMGWYQTYKSWTGQ